MTDNDLLNDSDPFREELVAYLDGELDAEQSRKVEERAATDPDTRRALEELDRSWHLLDDIDASITNEDFTRTTLEMVALAAADDAKRAKVEAPRRRSRRWLIAVASVVAASLAGFGLVYAFVPDPNAQILHDLPLLENLDQYRQVDDIKFLRSLQGEKRFASEAEDVQNVAPDESIAQRKQRIVDLTPAQKEEILRRDERFLALSDVDRQNIRTLHDQLRSAPDGAKLRETMNRYCQWLSDAVDPYTKFEISDLKPDQRIAKVREIVGKQSQENVNRLSDKDRQAVVRWMEAYATEHESVILEFIKDKSHGQPLAVNADQGATSRNAMVLALRAGTAWPANRQRRRRKTPSSRRRCRPRRWQSSMAKRRPSSRSSLLNGCAKLPGRNWQIAATKARCRCPVTMNNWPNCLRNSATRTATS